MKKISVVLLLMAPLLVGCSIPYTGYSIRKDVDAFYTPEVSEKNPWTHLDFKNDPQNFQFAVISDAFGAGYRGKAESLRVLGTAMDKLNLIQPEFVICVGDLIKGYTEDMDRVRADFNRLDSIVGRLEMPFFYIAGNHDITNDMMTPVWNEQYGRASYHFIYKGVLFLCLNSQDPPQHQISPAQVEYVQKVLEKNPNVRWTCVFLHTPMWLNAEAPSPHWLEIEDLLSERPYTVFAGHYHRYGKHERNDMNYYILATTGGGSSLRGPAAGRFDHLAWVTMTDSGPRVSNLMLEGIWGDSVMRVAHDDLIKDKDFISISPLNNGGSTFTSGETEMTITNHGAFACHFTGAFKGHEGLRIEPAAVETKIELGASEKIKIKLTADTPIELTEPLKIEFDWRMLFLPHNETPLTAEGTDEIVIDK